MATIYNTDLSKELKDGAKIQQMHDEVPSQLAEKVVPVMEVNPKMLRRCNIIRRAQANNSVSATVYTTPTDKDFYLCSISMGMIKDATATSVFSGVQGFVSGYGSAIPLLIIPGITLTAQTGTLSVTFATPILMGRGTVINAVNSTNVGNVICDVCLTGYTVDNSNA